MDYKFYLSKNEKKKIHGIAVRCNKKMVTTLSLGREVGLDAVKACKILAEMKEYFRTEGQVKPSEKKSGELIAKVEYLAEQKFGNILNKLVEDMKSEVKDENDIDVLRRTLDRVDELSMMIDAKINMIYWNLQEI